MPIQGGAVRVQVRGAHRKRKEPNVNFVADQASYHSKMFFLEAMINCYYQKINCLPGDRLRITATVLYTMQSDCNNAGTCAGDHRRRVHPELAADPGRPRPIGGRQGPGAAAARAPHGKKSIFLVYYILYNVRENVLVKRYFLIRFKL